ncbi:MAG: dethiobiotin synthase [Porticoccaceae bacterium]|nr:dethiobiotin synthase [Porticoccaceae bacterium]
MKGYFVTATDTDAGKTFVGAALLAAAGQAGLRTAALKPVAAGAEQTAEGLCNDDALILMKAANTPLPYPWVNPVCLTPAIAPHIAAREAGMELSVATVLEACRPVLQTDVDWLLVEGAGGWRVPLNEKETVADLAKAFGFPVVLVVAMRLGCINHALLSAEAIRADGLQLAGWIANSTTAEMHRYADNVATLKQRLKAPLLGEIPYLSGIAPEGTHLRAANFIQMPAL